MKGQKCHNIGTTPVEEIIVEGLFQNFHKICFIKNMYCVTCENNKLYLFLKQWIVMAIHLSGILNM